MFVFIIIMIVIFSIVAFIGLVGLLVGGAADAAITLLIIGGLMLALSIVQLSRIRHKRNAAKIAGVEAPPVTQNTVQNQQTIHIHISNQDNRETDGSETEGRYCPYCGAEFDDSNDEVCPYCGARTKKGRPDPQ